MIRAVSIDKTKGGRKILSGVSFEAEPGEAVAIIGPNGSGKSTLLYALSLIDPPDSGIISVDKKDFQFEEDKRDDVEGIWPTVTLVFQQLFLWPHLTVEENVLLPARHKDQVDDVEQSLGDLAKTLNIGDFLGRYPSQLSQGERQRVALLRALILNPRYLLLDEITSAQDIEQMTRILGVLRETKEQGISLVFVSHQLGFVQKLADRFVFLDHGEVVDDGSIEELSSPKSERLREFVTFI